jgi:choline dehydrogenase-like flavoprotein
MQLTKRRLADASIMPEDCKANTDFTCVMIGLMAASRIARAEKGR